MRTIEFSEFEKVEMLVGTIVSAEPLEKARKPSFKLQIDLGEAGIKPSSAQITDHYSPEDLIGSQVIVVANFDPKRIAGFKSECLVLGIADSNGGIVLLRPDLPIENGSRVF